jgi:hypothetical protein
MSGVVEVVVHPYELLIKLQAYPVEVGMPEVLVCNPVLL